MSSMKINSIQNLADLHLCKSAKLSEKLIFLEEIFIEYHSDGVVYDYIGV